MGDSKDETNSDVEKPEVSMNFNLAFIGDWFIRQAGITKKFVVFFYPADCSVLLYDQANRLTFLRRTPLKNISERDFFIGAKVKMMGRIFLISDYANEATRNLLDKFRKKCFAMLLSPLFPKKGSIVDCLIQGGYEVHRARILNLTNEQVHDFFEPKERAATDLVHGMKNGPVFVLELLSNDALEKLRAARSGQTHLAHGGAIPEVLIELFKDPITKAWFYLPDDKREMCTDTRFFFDNPKVKPLCTYNNSVLCVVRPHCIRDGTFGKILQDIINANFKIVSMVSRRLAHEQAAEFLEIYDTLMHDNEQYIEQLSSGVCIALEVSPARPMEDYFEKFRNLCGPLDPEMAKVLRPDSLRGRYGHTRPKSGVHCTDLSRDIKLELNYMFEILAIPTL